MKTFRCGDLVPGCTQTFRGTPEEILTGVGGHARADHGMTEIGPDLVAAVRDRMVPVD
ncbi:DUF1059 domain-containing protein [Cellulomonas bogoriensis]|uniref:DUF1059 domain-containing protein n=1 Tax=Cellulomonas bogoriensis TaxID=301388 RepID=UPI0009FD3F5B|nr:DUF1059 domain-containing protein [Cellulomonas bogoriensis]